MLGVDHQHIHCRVTNCRYNEKHVVRDGKTNKIVETHYTCTKENIYLDKNGKCKQPGRSA